MGFDTSPERIILQTDRRGMQTLAASLPPVDWDRLAGELLACAREDRVLLCTGFPVNDHPETDGPAGTLFLARALSRLGGRVALVSLPALLEVLEGLIEPGIETIALPAGRPGKGVPGTAVTIEVCGRTGEGCYRNMHGEDISAAAPWMESVIGDRALIAVGDGGNEFGFGAAPAAWFERFAVQAPASSCDHLVPAEVSNWGALAILAALQRLTGEPLMPHPSDYQEVLDELARRGLVDGFTGLPGGTEDGLASGSADRIIEALTRWATTGQA